MALPIEASRKNSNCAGLGVNVVQQPLEVCLKRFAPSFGPSHLISTACGFVLRKSTTILLFNPRPYACCEMLLRNMFNQNAEMLYHPSECLVSRGDPQIGCELIQGGKRRVVCHGPGACGADGLYSAGEVRRMAKRAKDAAQARRLLAIAAVLDGALREDAAKIGGMDRQTLRDWVIRFNEQGADGLINIPSPGVPPKLGKKHRAFLARLVEEGPIPAVHGVVRWRACDLIMRLHEEFGLSVSDDTIYRALKDLGFSHVSARPKPTNRILTPWRRSKKLCRPRGGSPRQARASHTGRGLVPGRDAGRPEDNSLIAGPGRARVRAPRMISAPSRPICSAQYAPNMEPARPSYCRSATPKPCSFISMRSPQR